MSIERIRLQGLQSRSLELGKNKSTPTQESDIGARARLYKGLVMNAAIAHMALEGMSGGRGSQEMIEAQTAQIRGARREIVIAGFNLEGFDLIVKDKIALLKEKAREEAEDAELQAKLGEVPPVTDIVNFGTHAFKKDDAGGFEPKRLGW